jgi:hypothetical protein
MWIGDQDVVFAAVRARPSARCNFTDSIAFQTQLDPSVLNLKHD